MAPFRPFATLWPHLLRFRGGYIAAAGALLLGNGFQLASPLALRHAVDAVATPAAVYSPDNPAARYALLFVALALGQGLFRFLSRRLFLGNARRVEHDLRARYFRNLIHSPAEHIEAGRRGDFSSRATHDLLDVRLFLGAGVLNFAQTLVLLVCATVLLWRINPALTVVALGPFPIITVLMRWHSPRLHRRYREANRRAGDLSAAVQEGLDGLRLVRAFGREAWQVDRFDGHNRQLRDAQVGVVRSWAALFPAVGVLAGLGQVAVLGYGGTLVFEGAISVGEFVAFSAYLVMLTWPMAALGWTMGLVQRGAAALDRLKEILDLPEDSGGVAVPDPGASEQLVARGVHYRYPDATDDAVAGVDLSVPAGGYWALVGDTGAGKTTLVELLARVRVPTGGGIRIGGRALTDLDHGALRRHLAVVPQQGTFFAATVAENVYLGRPRDPERLSQVLATAELHPELDKFPDRVDTRVGEGGITLSGGQRQRLALARALYGEPSILALDAAFSSLDTITARRVLNNLRRDCPGLTLLVVSHRGAEIDDADGVVFLHKGRVVGQGSHRELLATDPAYRALYREEELRRELAEVVA